MLEKELEKLQQAMGNLHKETEHVVSGSIAERSQVTQVCSPSCPSIVASFPYFLLLLFSLPSLLTLNIGIGATKKCQQTARHRTGEDDERGAETDRAKYPGKYPIP